MKTADIDLIRALPLFGGMEKSHFETLIKAAFLQRFPTHVVLVNEGDQPDFLHIVIEGAVELFSTHAGRETTLWILRPISTFILAAVIRDELYLNSVRALEPSRILMIPAEAVRDIFDQDAIFARSIVCELAARYRSAVKDIKNLKLRPSLERLANWLIQTDVTNNATGSFEIPLDKRTLAAALGMTPENLSRNFATLAAYGVKVSGRKIKITNIPTLTQLAKPTALIDDPHS